MSKESRNIGLVAAALAVSLAAGAQPTASTADQGAPAGQPTYSSAFEGYRSFSADEVGDWHKANDTARDIGGWRAYAREIQAGSKQEGAQGHEGHGVPAASPAPASPAAQSAPPAAAARPAAPAPSAPADPHQGHHQ
jgi:hypothetical protein